MNTRHSTTAALALLLALLATVIAVAMAQAPGAVTSSESSVYRFADGEAVAGSSSQLLRVPGAAAMELRTSGLEPSAPYTAWWVVFNTPEGCSDACGEDDIFAADGSMDLNPDATISILFADGALSDAGGTIAFSGVLPEGRPLGEVLAGPGLTDASGAEIHLVVRAHGDLDPARAYAQLSTFEPTPLHGGDCSVCSDVQFVVYQPGSAAAAR